MYQVFLRLEPYYLTIGMTHEQYWNDDPWLAKVFREAHKMRTEMRNQELWLQGLYNFQAFSTALGNFSQAFSKHKNKPQRYLEEPIRITPKTEEEERQEKIEARKKVIEYFSNFEKRWKKE